jgi:hypothetical protein
MTHVAAHYSFGTGGSVRPYLKKGWSLVERDFTWTDGLHAVMSLPVPAISGRLVLELYLKPMRMLPVIRRQRVVVSVNGTQIGDDYVDGDCALAFDVTQAASAGGPALNVELHCPDAVVPAALGESSDERRLGVAVREMMLFDCPARPDFTPRLRPPLPNLPGGVAQAVAGLTGLAIPDLAGCFESLGHNCEFGMAQRAMAHEGLGLLRFGGIPVDKLVEALDLGFEGIEAPDNLMVYLSEADLDANRHEREFVVHDRRYGTEFHTGDFESGSTPEAVVAKFAKHLAFLRRKMLEDVVSGHKIFVFQHPGAPTLAHIWPILNVLRSHGPNTLLFVTDQGPHAPGTVEQIDDDLFHGFVGRLAPQHEMKLLDLPAWIGVCANTYRLWRESGRGQS